MLPSDRIGYVCKMYPRFSETFIVSEVIAREAHGEMIDLFSLRTPNEGRFHPMLGHVRAEVTYLDAGTPHARELWSSLRTATPTPPVLAALLEASVRDVAQALDLAGRVRDRGITHLHAHFGSVATTVARLAAALAGITYSFTAHAKDIFHEDIDPNDLACKLREADHVVTVSDYNERYLRDRFGAAAANIYRVYNGLDLDSFPFQPDRVGDGPDVVAVGRLVEKKGFDVLLEACAVARDRGTPLDCVVVGSGEREGQLRELLAAHSLEPHVRLLGPLPQERVREIVASATVMAAPCVVGTDGNADGLPTVVLEAMALGTPVVATPVTGLPEAIRDGDTGLLVPERDVPALANALIALRDNAPRRRELARRARMLVEAEFSSARQARQLRHLLPASRCEKVAVS